MTMAQRIRDCRKSMKMTQKELANKLGVNEAAVSKWENDVVENIPRSTIKAMAALFSVSPCYLMAFSDDPAPVQSAMTIYDRVSMELGQGARELLKDYASMNKRGQDLAIKMVHTLIFDPTNTEQEKDMLKNA